MKVDEVEIFGTGVEKYEVGDEGLSLYKIVARYDNGSTEIIDTADTHEEAQYLRNEYHLAFIRR